VGEELYDPNYKPDVDEDKEKDDDSEKEKDDDQKTADEEVSQDQSVDIDGKDDFHEQKKEKIEADKKEEAAEKKMNGIYLMIGGISLFLVIAGVVFCCIRARQKKNGYDSRTYTEVSDNVRESGTGIN
jgi:cobalamin biosynthesis protein CobT